VSYSFVVELPVYSSEDRPDELAAIYAEALAAAGTAFADVMRAKGAQEPAIKVSVTRTQERIVSGVVTLSPSYKVTLSAAGHVSLPQRSSDGAAPDTGTGDTTTG
jgi:hypothetical protein